MMKPSLKLAVAETSVFWDIKTYPVPHGVDAGVVGPCIQHYLMKLGYSGPLTIIAVGRLTDVPGDVLRALSSTGIVLRLVPLGSTAILETIYEWFDNNQPPANMMIISSDPSIFPECRHFSKYNTFELFPHDSPNPQSLWNNFLLKRAPKAHKYESASWLCSVCSIHGKGFENFNTHLSTPEHIEEATLIDKETAAVTLVIWDIKSCPLPPGCNARWVAPSIKQHLKDLGYSGPLTIIAIGHLKDLPDDILQTLSSTGILLHHYDAFTSVNSMHVIDRWTNLYSPPANMMFICPYSKNFPDVVAHLRFVLGYSIIEPFPDGSPYSESLWRSFLLQDSGTLEEDECSVTDRSASWFCSVCDIPGKGFEIFTTHLSSQEHKDKVTQMDKETVAATLVLWDIKGCPVPPNFNASLVAPCIKKYLESLGYPGPITISAIGQLQNVPDNVLRAVSSTGIVLNQYDAYNSGHILPYLYLWSCSYLPPADILVLFPYSEDLPNVLVDLVETGYTIINPFPYDSSDSKSLWKNILRQVSGTLEEDECSESGEPASWVCSVCSIFGKGFENFTMHLSRQVHEQKMSVYQSDEKHEEAVKSGAEASPNSHPKNATKKQGQPNSKNKKNNGRKRK